MNSEAAIFEKTYKNYIEQISRIDLASVAPNLGAVVEADGIAIPVFGRPHIVSENGITDPAGKKPFLDVCVILCKYVLMCPQLPPQNKDWVAYRDFKDSGPLTVYFANDVERNIATLFQGNIGDLKTAGQSIGGKPPDIDAVYDFSMQFDALPKVPLMLLFNDADNDFGAHCSVLFERRAEQYLDGECLAMIGRLLYTTLKKKMS